MITCQWKLSWPKLLTTSGTGSAQTAGEHFFAVLLIVAFPCSGIKASGTPGTDHGDCAGRSPVKKKRQEDLNSPHRIAQRNAPNQCQGVLRHWNFMYGSGKQDHFVFRLKATLPFLTPRTTRRTTKKIFQNLRNFRRYSTSSAPKPAYAPSKNSCQVSPASKHRSKPCVQAFNCEPTTWLQSPIRYAQEAPLVAG